MRELGSYQLIDFIPFSKSIYVGLFEQLNDELAFVGVVGLLLIPLFVFVPKGGWRPGRHVGRLLGLLAIGPAFFFFFERYGQLNWAAEWVGWAFAAEGVMVAIVAGLDDFEVPRGQARWSALVGALMVVALAPIVALVAEGSLTATELPGLAPDLSCGVLLALLGGVRTRWAWACVLIPALWLCASSLTWWALESPLHILLPLGCALVFPAVRFASSIGRS